MRVIELEEETACLVPAMALTEAEAVGLHQTFGRQLEVEFPGPILGPNYRLRSRGYVGHLPLSRDLGVRIQPKVAVRNLFGMLEQVYRLGSLQLWEGHLGGGSVPEVFEQWVAIFAQRVLDRVHRGLLRDYVEQQAELTWVRGRLLCPRANGPPRPAVRCQYAEQTTDLPDNRLLAWTLYRLRRYPFQREAVQRLVHRAFALLAGAVELEPVAPVAWGEEHYHRLNQDYRPLHALCRFFLEQSGPALGRGEWECLGFAVHMPALFETFVAEWLQRHLAGTFGLQIQRRVPLEGSPTLAFQIDLVLVDRATGRPLAVLDTKYKRQAEPEEGDIQQVVAYAVRLGTNQAFLVYPSPAVRPLLVRVGPVEVRTLVFDLGDELTQAGEKVTAVLSRLTA